MNNEREDDSHLDYFYDQPGRLPGYLDLDADALPPNLVLINYNEFTATHINVNSPEECANFVDSESVTWVDVQGLGNEDTWDKFGKLFNLHPLTLEDVVNVPQRPKVVDYDDQLVIIVWMVLLKSGSNRFHKEQVSLVLGKDYLLTVQEEPEYDCFDPVRDRITNNKGNIRKQGADFLAYALIDAIIDGFFPVLEEYGEQIEFLETEVVNNPNSQTLEKIYHIRRRLLSLRRAIWPQRDAINILIRDGSDLISPEIRIYLRDSYNHAVQVMDMVESYREIAASLMDVYLSSVSNKMNEIMKLLTIISTIFIPLTFIAGVYGMNFNTDKSPFNMPELNAYWGYPICLLLMLAIASCLVYYFWKRGWFNNISALK